MKIFVPKYLRKLGVLDNLCKAISEYAKNPEKDTDSFSDYQFYLKIDPVKRFIRMCLSEKTAEISGGQYTILDENGNTVGVVDPDSDVILDYLTRLFYSVRGTYDVLKYMGTYLGLKFEGDPVYTADSISFVLTDIVGDDLAIFEESLNNFLDALLYYGKLEYDIKDFNLDVSIDSRINGRLSVNTFKRFELDANL